MTPPEAPIDGSATQGETPPAVSSCPDTRSIAKLEVLKQRKEFLAASRARRQGTTSMLVQARKRRKDEPHNVDLIRVGFTCSKKVGNAVARNRAKRRLREAARAVLPLKGHKGWDYVLVGRAEATAARPFEDLKRDLMYALKKLHQERK